MRKMTWRNRNLFKKKAVPVQKFNMGGSVRGVEALKNVAPTIGTFDYDNAVNMMGGGMVDMPVPQMQMGGSPQIEMFESGDSAINEALNSQAAIDTMNQSLMTGGGDAVPQSMMAAPMAEEGAPMMEDQGPKDMSAAKQFSDQALEEAKESSQDIIAQAMGEIEKEIDTVEEISTEEMKDLAELISMQQRRLDSASTELSNVMELGAVEDITLFDNEFEREVQKKYPLVAAALEKTLPKIMDTTQIEEETMPSTDSEIDKMYGKGAAEEAMGEALGMPSGDTPVPTMKEGGDPADAKQDIVTKLLEERDRLLKEIATIDQNKKLYPNPRTGKVEELPMKPEDLEKLNRLTQELSKIEQQISSGMIIQKQASATPEPSITDMVKADVSGKLLDTNRRTYEDVLKQPGVKRIYSDLEKMIDQAGIGNVKDTKATGTQAATGVMRDVAAGEAGGRLKKAQLELGLVGDIESDPYGTKAGALTSTKLGLLTKGDNENDKMQSAAGLSAFNWMAATGIHVPRSVRDMAGLEDTYEKKKFNGQEKTFSQLFNDALANANIRALTQGEEGTKLEALRQSKFLEILARQWGTGIFNPKNIEIELLALFPDAKKLLPKK